MTKIHHNTLKKAAKYGLSFMHDMATGQFQVFCPANNTGELASAADPKDALDLAILALQTPGGDPIEGTKPARKPKKPAKRKARKPAGDDMDEDGDEGAELRSVVKAKYRVKYQPHKMTCGDELAQKVRAKFMTVKDPDTGKPRLDFDRFVEFAKRNECWVEGYRSLRNRDGSRNNGMIRMNVLNRLRARVRKEKEIRW